MLNENNFKRMCSFYVSDIHLSTMILPYLSEKLEKGEILTTFLEKDIQREMELLVSKTNIRESLKNIIKNIDWNKTDIIKYTELEKKLKKYDGRVNILVTGTEDYINHTSKNLQKYLQKNNNIKINEIDAYELEENKNKFNEILKRYTYMLNTSGEYLVTDIFKSEDINKKEII